MFPFRRVSPPYFLYVLPPGGEIHVFCRIPTAVNAVLLKAQPLRFGGIRDLLTTPGTARQSDQPVFHQEPPDGRAETVETPAGQRS